MSNRNSDNGMPSKGAKLSWILAEVGDRCEAMRDISYTTHAIWDVDVRDMTDADFQGGLGCMHDGDKFVIVEKRNQSLTRHGDEVYDVVARRVDNVDQLVYISGRVDGLKNGFVLCDMLVQVHKM